MRDTTDLLQIKIEKAKRELSLETANAIDSVNWRAVILTMRETKGYTFEQLGDLELETELLLCGLVNVKDYPLELENRMKITKSQAGEIVNYMNEKVFSRIKEELIKNTERKSVFAKSEKNDAEILNSAGIEIVSPHPDPLLIKEREDKAEVHPILAQKLSGPMQTGTVKTEHTLDNITKSDIPTPTSVKVGIPRVDPYRELPE